MHDQNTFFRLNVQICHMQSLTDRQLWFIKFDTSRAILHKLSHAGSMDLELCPLKNRSTKNALQDAFQLHPAGVRTLCIKEGASQSKDTAVT